MEVLAPGLLALVLAAFIARTIDAVVGGGGLIQIPALFAVYPGEAPATLFGTNKCASVVGTANATWRYARRVVMPWHTILPAAIAAFAFSYLGAAAVAWLPRDAVRPLILDLAALAYFLPNGHVLPLLAAAMACANVAGSIAGTWLALRYGSAFVRHMFLLVVSVLIVRFAWDTLALL